MSRKSTWTNQDGLVVGFGPRNVTAAAGATTASKGVEREILVKLLWSDINAGGGTAAGTTAQEWFKNGAVIPVGSVITSATIFVESAFAGTNATIDIGTYYADSKYNAANSKTAGGEADADGIDVAVPITALGARDVVLCDGAQVARITDADGLFDSITLDGDVVVGFDVDTAALTGGEATLVVKYIPGIQ